MKEMIIRLSNYYGELQPNTDYTIDDLLDEIDRLDSELDSAHETIENLEADIKDNYKPIPVSEQNGVSFRDFI